MLSVIKIFGLILLILVFGNRAWVKRHSIGAKCLWGGLTTILVVILAFEIIEYKNNPIEKSNGLTEKKYEMVDMNGNVLTKNVSILDFIFSPYHQPAIDARTEISEEEAINNNITVGIMAGVLFGYWIILLLLFEREEKLGVPQKDDMELLKKYNPMVAACISQNRNMLGRDIIAVILNLIEKQKIILRIENAPNGKYNYMLSQGVKPNDRLDSIEKLVYDWVFEEVGNTLKYGHLANYMSINKENVLEINLEERLKSFPEEEDTLAKTEELKHMTNDWLKRIKANQKSVPFLLKLFNNILVFLSVIVIGDHIMDNGLQIVISNLGIIAILFVIVCVIFVLPAIYIVSLIILKTILVMFKGFADINEKHTGRKLYSKAASIIIATIFMAAFIYFSPLDMYLIIDILLLGVVLLIILTDDLMLKHHPEILIDYLNLKRIEEKLEKYSMMEDRNVEHIELWNKYYVFAVALGIPIQVNEQSNIDFEDLQENLIINTKDLESIFYVCKSHMEIMGGADFSDIEKGVDILKDTFKI